jgi:WD40 repeat protein
MTTKGDCELKLWNAQTGAEALTVAEKMGAINCVKFSPDGRRLASCGYEGNVKLWDVANGQEALTLRSHLGGVLSVAFSRDGNRLVSAGIDHFVRVWDATPLEEGARQEVGSLGHEGGVRSVAFSPDGRYLASAAADETVRVWDFQRGLGSVAHPPLQILKIPKINWSGASNLTFSRDGQRLAAGEGGPNGGRGWLKVWETNTWKELPEIPRATAPVTFSPDGRYLVAACGPVGTDFPLKIWDAAMAREIHTLKGHVLAAFDMAFAPRADVPLLGSASADGTLRIWDVRSGTLINTLEWDTGAVRCLAFSPDGRLVAAAGLGELVRIWDTRSWEQLHELPDLTGCIHSVAFHSKDSRVLAWTSSAGTFKLWDSATKEVRTFHGHTGAVECVAFSPDGDWIASASRDGTVKIWKTPPVPESTGIAEK